MKVPASLLFLLLYMTAVPAAAEQIKLSNEAIERLGIAVDQPGVSQANPASPLQGHVTLPPGHEIAVSPNLPGTLHSLLVAAGDEVSAGQPLAKISSSAYLELQRTYLETQASFALAQQQFQRDSKLNKEGLLPQRRLEETRAKLTQTRIKLSAYASDLQLSGLLPEQLKALSSTGQLNPQLTLRAPLAGAVLSTPQHVGSGLAAGTPVAHIADLTTLWLEISIPGALRKQFVSGQPVQVIDRNVMAEIKVVGRYLDDATQTLVARAEITQGSEALLPGEVVMLRPLRVTAALPTLPRGAIARSGKQTFVFVRNAIGFEVRPVTVIDGGGRSLSIREGLDPQERVAVRGIAALKAAWLGIGGGE